MVIHNQSNQNQIKFKSFSSNFFLFYPEEAVQYREKIYVGFFSAEFTRPRRWCVDGK